ncbi:hypothetical protein ACOJBM_02245 [Rhizobium beringeri]
MGGVQVASADDAEWGLPGPALRSLSEPKLAWGAVLRAANDKADRGNEAAGLLPGPIVQVPETGAPGFQQYDDCPTGYSIAEDESGHGGSTQTSCVKYADGSGGYMATIGSRSTAYRVP